MSSIRLKIEACNLRHCVAANLYIDQRVKIVRRHHLIFHWWLTLPPLGCDTNKSSSNREAVILGVPSPVVSPSLAVAWFGLAWVHLKRRLLGGLAHSPQSENNNTKSRPLSDDQNTHKTNVPPTLSFCNALFVSLLFGSEMTHPQVKSSDSTTACAYFDSYFKRRSIFAQIYGRETIVIWLPPALSVNGLFTETDRIMAWVLAGGEWAMLHFDSDLVSKKKSKHLWRKQP